MANKVRLIDAEKCYCIAKAYHSDFEQNLANLHSLRELLDDCPTVDAEEVVHGKWEKRTDVFGFVRCSNCHDCNIYDDWADGKKWNYCPNCGAKMDGDGNGN